ncbi:MAG: hypothetical protein LBU17_00610 [Treponema sp.]|jgi:hypothetical protein|nr:hypothetical protein [Treponema sp.]
MAQYIKHEILLDHQFDRNRCRHTINGIISVLHCHHFATLTTQVANDCSLLDAKKLLADSAEDAFYLVLTGYYKQYSITSINERISIGEQYFSATGLGKLKVRCAGVCSGEVVLEHSHVDEGWIKKWGLADQPVNHIGCGYINALFSAVFDRSKRTFRAVEQQSIAMGADVSIIRISDVAV